jgi:hypothetical protein
MLSSLENNMNRIYINSLVYEDTPPYDQWLKYLIGGILVLTTAIGFFLILFDPVGTWFMLGETTFLALIFYSIMPRKYQVLEDRIRIVLGRPFSVNIRFSNIREIRRASSGDAYVYYGIRLATNSRSVVEIMRKRGLGIVISPRDREFFLQQFNQAMENYRKMNPRIT